MHPTQNDIPGQIRERMARLLNHRLFDAIDLASQVKHAHWTVRGPNFIALHELFDRVHTEVETWIDDMAERAVALGGRLVGTARAAAQYSTLPEYPHEISRGEDHVAALSAALAAFATQVRTAIDAADEAGDADTADVFTQVSRSCDKQLWLVEAHRV